MLKLLDCQNAFVMFYSHVYWWSKMVGCEMKGQNTMSCQYDETSSLQYQVVGYYVHLAKSHTV